MSFYGEFCLKKSVREVGGESHTFRIWLVLMVNFALKNQSGKSVGGGLIHAESEIFSRLYINPTLQAGSARCRLVSKKS